VNLRLSHAGRQEGLTITLLGMPFLQATTASALVPVLVRGTMSNGASPSTVATVAAYVIDPNDRVTFPETSLTPVGTDTTAADGSFSVRANPTDQMTQLAAQNDGWVNLFLVMVERKAGSTYTQVRAITRLLPGATTGSATDRTDPTKYGTSPDDSAAVSVQMADPGTLVGTDSDPQPNSVVPPGIYCGDLGTVASTTGDGIIQEIHAVGNMDSHSIYGKTSDSSIEAAFQWNFQDAPVTVNGSVHVGNTTTVLAKVDRGMDYGGDAGRSVHGQFTTHKDKYVCRDSRGTLYGYLYQTTAVKWNGNITMGTTNMLLTVDHACWQYPEPRGHQFPPYSSITHESTAAQSWTAGFSAFGFGLTIKSGFSTYVSNSWHMGSSTAAYEHYICGTNDAPAFAARTFAGYD
jgi:hypothetical protein